MEGGRKNRTVCALRYKMKSKFSKKWIRSKQKRKQKKYQANAPTHIKRKMLSSNLSKDLRKKYSRRSFVLRKGDKVKIMRGSFKGKQGKVDKINLKNLRVSVEGIQRQKRDGTKVNVYIPCSKLQIHELNLEDKKRMNSIQRKTKPIEKQETESIDKKGERIVKEKEKEGKK